MYTTSMDNYLISDKKDLRYLQLFQASLGKRIFLDRHYSIVVQIPEMERNETVPVTISTGKLCEHFKWS